MKSLQEQMRKLRAKWRDEDKRQASRSHAKPTSSQKKPVKTLQPATALYLSLGIDFGTTYTKVAWKDLATDAAGFIDFPGKKGPSPFLKSEVRLDKSGRYHTPLDDGFATAEKRERFLKMRIGGSDLYTESQSQEEHAQPSVDALAAFYLSAVIRYSCDYVSKAQAERAEGRVVKWLPAMGIPTPQFDSPVRSRFERILAVAWKISASPLSAGDGKAIQEAYDAIEGPPAAAELGLTTYPEIGAAVLSFLVSPEAQPGVYIYFDIGGGTLAGVSFRYRNRDGNRSVEYYSAVVRELGVEAVVRRLRQSFGVPSSRALRQALVNGHTELTLPLAYDAVKPDVQRAVAEVVAGGRLRDKQQNWRLSRVDDGLYYKWYPEFLRDDKVQNLVVFVGGGGAQSKHHQRWIKKTYGEFKHHNAGIPPYELTALPVPSKLQQDAEHSAHYNRLAVAYGLTAAPATAVETIGLPSHATVERDVTRAHIDFDAISTEIYGEPL